MRPGILLPTSIDAAVILPSSGGSLGCVQSHAPPARESDHEDREEHGEDDDKRVAALIFFFFFSHKRQIADRNSGSAGKDGQSVRRKPLNPALQKPLTAVFPYCRDETSLFASAERRKCDAEPEDR